MKSTGAADPRDPTVARLAFALTPDRRSGAPSVTGADGVRRKMGDLWVEGCLDMGLAATMRERRGGLHVVLTFRIDGMNQAEWDRVNAMPTVVTLLPAAPIAVFALEIDGMHGRGAYPVGANEDDALPIRTLVLETKVSKAMTVVGIDRGRIRSIKTGVGLARIWDLLAQTFEASPLVFDDAAYAAILERMKLPPQVIFRDAIAVHLQTP